MMTTLTSSELKDLAEKVLVRLALVYKQEGSVIKPPITYTRDISVTLQRLLLDKPEQQPVRALDSLEE